MIAAVALLLMTASVAGRAVKKAAGAVAKAPGVAVRTVTRAGRRVQQVLLNLWVYWYVSKKRVLPQERFLFGGFIQRRGVRGAVDWVIRKFRGLLGGRGLGKSKTLMRKALILAFLNHRTVENPIWGAIFGRTLKEVHDKLLPVLLQECAALKRDLGFDWTPVVDLQRGVVVFPFGAAIYLLSYENSASLQMARGYTLGWAVIDELEVARVSIDEIMAVINFAIRDPDAKHKAFCWASTPKGMKGMPRLHADARRRLDPNWYLVHGTIYDNPYLSPQDVETIKATIPSRRLWAQEGLAICVMPRHMVFPEYADKVHLRPHVWNKSDKTWISIDWGLSKAYIAAYKINAAGDWFIAKERKVVDTTRRRFREVVRAFIEEVIDADGGAPPYGMSCDRAIRSERSWLYRTFGKLCGGRVLWLSANSEFRVEWGCAIISSLLEPDDGKPKIYVSDALNADTDFATMGIRGAFQRYTYEIGRDEQTGEEIILDTPSKKNAADDPIDALRYAIVATRHMAPLHGGKPLPFLAAANDDRSEDESKSSRRNRNAA